MPGLLWLLAVADGPIRAKGVCIPVSVEALGGRQASRIVREADAIWAPYRVRLLGASEPCAADLYRGPRLVVRLERTDAAQSIGRVVFVDGEPTLPIALSAPAAEALSRRRPEAMRLRHDPFEVLERTDVVLGRALAHEIGHVLLGREHATTGLMRPELRPEDVPGPADARFALTAEQSAVIARAKKCPLMQAVADAERGRAQPGWPLITRR